MTHPNAAKGAKAEREAAGILSDLLGWNIKRRHNLGTQEDLGDLYGFPRNEVVVQVADWQDVLRAVRVKPVDAEVQRINAGATFAASMIRMRGGVWRVVLTPEQMATWMREAVNP